MGLSLGRGVEGQMVLMRVDVEQLKIGEWNMFLQEYCYLLLSCFVPLYYPISIHVRHVVEWELFQGKICLFFVLAALEFELYTIRLYRSYDY